MKIKVFLNIFHDKKNKFHPKSNLSEGSSEAMKPNKYGKNVNKLFLMIDIIKFEL
jgi:hypothetical protein